MDDIYKILHEGVKDLKKAEDEGNSIDFFLAGNQVKVAALDDLFKFARISDTTLVHKAEKDLWKIGENDTGECIIERLFDPQSKEPLRI